MVVKLRLTPPPKPAAGPLMDGCGEGEVGDGGRSMVRHCSGTLKIKNKQPASLENLWPAFSIWTERCRGISRETTVSLENQLVRVGSTVITHDAFLPEEDSATQQDLQRRSLKKK